MKQDVFLEEARLGPRSPLIIQYDEGPHLSVLPRRFRAFALTDLAHVVMLTEKGILRKDRGAKLLGGLLEVWELGPDRFPWDKRTGSYLVQIEQYLGARLGDDIAGRIQTGRSRNDQDASADRLFMRDLLLELMADLAKLIAAVVARAKQHAATVMPGYTHLQHAQPWTFGHYMMRQASVLDRDFERLRGAYGRTNLSVLGGAANAGTSWPLDRRRTAELLGTDGIVMNSCDGGLFARDFLEEDVAMIALLAGNLGRFATDLYLWSSWEFGFVEIADGLAGTSSIMPQKKNPHAFERVKSVGGQAAGWMASMMGCQRGVFATDLDFEFADNTLPLIGDSTLGSLRLMAEAVATMKLHENVMAEKAGAFWSTASHLADEIVRRFDLPFREAHHVVGRLVKDSIETGLAPAQVTSEGLAKAAKAMGVPQVSLSTTELRDIMDARSFVESRATEGSVKPSEVRRHAELMDKTLSAHETWLKAAQGRVDKARENLLDRARALASAK